MLTEQLGVTVHLSVFYYRQFWRRKMKKLSVIILAGLLPLSVSAYDVGGAWCSDVEYSISIGRERLKEKRDYFRTVTRKCKEHGTDNFCSEVTDAEYAFQDQKDSIADSKDLYDMKNCPRILDALGNKKWKNYGE